VPQNKRGLGRGLGALIPSAPGVPGSAPGAVGVSGLGTTAADSQAVGQDEGLLAGVHYAEIAVGAVTPNPRQPRQTWDEDTIAELAASIREVGLLQPIVVRTLMPGRYELVMGERRWRACQQAGLEHVPAIVRDTGDDEMLREALIENLHREQLNPLDEAAAYRQLLDDFGATHEELAGRVGRSRPHITNTLRLLQLPADVQRRVAAGVLSAGHARALLALPSPQAQTRIAQRIVAEGLSVRAVEEIAAIGEVDPVKEPRQPRERPPAQPALRELADRLSDSLDTRVKVEMGRRKGKIVVEFASMDDLERIIKVLSPEQAAALGE
jgi:ParB family transcriptional regulator, chromosome partitioning protein